MRALPKWFEKIHEDRNEHPSIHSVCFNADGSHLLVAAAERILVYEPNAGTLIETLKGHKDVVNGVACARDGKKFASASADKTVIIWTNKFEGLLKYSHSDSVQCLAFNPVSHQLASCAVSDFAFWSTEQKAVQKYKVPSKVCSCAWTNDGQYLALGLANGMVSIRNRSGEEKSKIERPGASPVFGVSWSPPATGLADTLCVVDWSKTLSFYNLGGQAIGKERPLNFDPLCLHYFPDGEYLATAGCNKQVQVFTKEGIRLGSLGDEHEAWIWSVAIHPQGNSIVLGCQDGSLVCYNVAFSTVHALYAERYAFRENMCDVIIQHLSSGQKVRIKCRDLVHKIAIYRNRLAVQLPERVVLYETNSSDQQPMHYRVKEKISNKFDCSLLVVCSRNLVLCQDKKLQSLNFTGQLQREWNMDSSIRYIKVTGGPPGREGLLLGLKSGEVWRIFLDNSLPLLVTAVQSAVRCLDVNCSRNKIAVVDDQGRLAVRDLLTDTLLYQDTAVNSVAWNTHMENMVCYSHTGGGLSVRVGALPPRTPQNMQGVVVGLSGPTAYCLRGNYMSNVPITVGATMWQFVEAGLFEEAYQVASLGVPACDWEGLAHAALGALQLGVARNAFVKVRNLPWLTLLNELEERQKVQDIKSPKEVIQADILAFSGKFREAARLYQKCGQGGKALSMYSDLKMFDLAQEYVKEDASVDRNELVRLRAEWACAMHEPRAAAELLLSAGEAQRAIEIVAGQGWTDVLLDIGRRLNATTESSALKLVASHLRRLKALPLAVEIYRKLGAESEVVELHVEARDWEEAFRLAQSLPQLRSHVHLQHARWLLETDDFIAAHRAFVAAGQPNEASDLLMNLATSAISEKRYLDASYYNWLQAKQAMEMMHSPTSIDRENDLREFERLLKLANIYYAYDALHKYLQEPFTNNPPLTLFNISRYVANHLEKDAVAPKGVNLFTVLYTLAKQAEALGAHKLNFQVHNKLKQLKPPDGLYDQVAIKYISSRSSPGGFNDPEELLPMCYKCSTYSSHLHGNRCPSCEQGFIFSFVSFEILPLVEFVPEEGISEAEVERLLLAPPKSNEMHPDAFTDIMVHEELNVDAGPLDREALRMVDPRAVIMAKWPKPFKTRFYRNLIPDLLITVCPECFQAFHSEDFELQVLQKGHCPFCRTQGERLVNSC